MGTFALVFLVALLSAAPAVRAAPGADAFATGDYRRALEILGPQARRGHANAQYLLGRMYEEGLATAADPNLARQWYARAALQGHRDARNALVALDRPNAHTPASAPGNTSSGVGNALAAAPAPIAQSDRQRLHATLAGGGTADRDLTAQFVRGTVAAAEAGDLDAAVLLGEYFESELAGAPDNPAAARWYEIAARRDHPVALNNLGAMFYDGRGVLQSFAEAQRLYRRAAEGGDKVAQFNLALMLGQGRAGTVDLSAMNEWLSRSVAQNYARAQAQLARFHLEGIGRPRDQREAARLFGLAAVQGLPGAQYWFGRMTMRGEGVKRDLGAGAAWIIKAAEAGFESAMYEAARIYETGLGTVSDNVRALRFYRLAGDAGVKAAAERLSVIYAKGELDAKPDPAEATRWAAQASQ